MAIQHPFRFVLRISAITTFLAALLWGATATYFARKITSPRAAQLEDAHRVTYSFPQDHGMEISPFEVTTSDGQQIESLLLRPARVPGHAIKTRRMLDRLDLEHLPTTPIGTVVMLHGFGGRKEHQFAIAERFVAGGLQCIAYDSRAHGESSGAHCTYGLHEKNDLLQVIKTAKEEYGDLGPLLGFGNSMGAAVLLQSLPHSPEAPQFEAVVAVSPFAALDQLLSELATQRLGRLGTVLLPSALSIARWKTGLKASDIRPADHLLQANPTATLLISGNDDAVIRPHHTKTIYKALPPLSLNELASVPNATHHNVLATGGDALYEHIIRFYWTAISAQEPHAIASLQRDSLF